MSFEMMKFVRIWLAVIPLSATNKCTICYYYCYYYLLALPFEIIIKIGYLYVCMSSAEIGEIQNIK